MKHFPSILQTPHCITVETEMGVSSFLPDQISCFEDVTVSFEKGRVTLQADTTPVCRLRLRWNVNMPAGSQMMGDAWERGYGDLEWRGFVAGRTMPWYFLAKTEKALAGYGVKTNPDAFCCFACDPKGITLYLDVRCGGKGVILQGKTLLCAQLVCREYEGQPLFDGMQDFVKELATVNLTPQTPVYGFNNWYYAYGNSSHQEIMENTAHLASLTKGLENRPYMVIDDGWQVARKAGYIGGPWRQGNERFPDLGELARQMTEYDVLPGIWFRPLQNIDQNIPDSWRMEGFSDRLDPSVPQVLDYIREDVRTFVDWGFRLIKHDFSVIDLMGGPGFSMESTMWCKGEQTFADRTKTTAQILKDLYKAIHDAADGKALILGCNCAGHLGAGFMELNRTGDDISGVVWERTRRMGVNTLAFRIPQHNAWFGVDADCVGITRQIDWEKNKQWLYLLAHSGTPLFVSVAPDTLDEEQNAYLAQMLAVASQPQKVAQPLDLAETTCPARWLIGGNEVTFDWYLDSGIEMSRPV